MVTTISRLFSCLVIAVSLIACNAPPSGSPPGGSSLYDDIGGMPVIEQIVDHFIQQIGRDQAILKHFADTDIERFRRQLIAQLCVESGGPCEYTGDSMTDVHTGMRITEGEFNRTVDLLVAAMTEAGLSTPQQNRLLRRLAPMRGDIIYR